MLEALHRIGYTDATIDLLLEACSIAEAQIVPDADNAVSWKLIDQIPNHPGMWGDDDDETG